MTQLVKNPWGGVACFLAAAFLAGTCMPEPNMRGPQKLNVEYEEELRQWTESDGAFHSLDRVLVVHATYLSPSFRQSFGTQYLSVFGIDPGKVDSDLEMIATSVGRGHEFFVFADTSVYSWNNMDEEDSVWRMALWGGEEQIGVPPDTIQVFRGRGPNLKAFFPYLNDFGRSYFVVFPLDQPNGQPVLDPQNGTLTLKMASAFGEVRMNWTVKE